MPAYVCALEMMMACPNTVQPLVARIEMRGPPPVSTVPVFKMDVKARLMCTTPRTTRLETPVDRQERELVPELGDYIVIHHVHAEHEVERVEEPAGR